MYDIVSQIPYIYIYYTLNTMSQRPIRRFEALDLFFQTDEEAIEVEPEIEEDVSEIERQ